MENDRYNIKLIDAVSNQIPKARDLKKLLVAGADINYQTQEDGCTALMQAVKGQHDRITEYLLRQNANPLIKNKKNKIASDLTPCNSPLYLTLKDYELLFATLENDLPAVESIISSGALINFQEVNGYSALMIAAEQNYIEIADFLILEGANTNLTLKIGQNALDLTTDPDLKNLLKEADQILLAPKKNQLHRFFMGKTA